MSDSITVDYVCARCLSTGLVRLPGVTGRDGETPIGKCPVCHALSEMDLGVPVGADPGQVARMMRNLTTRGAAVKLVKPADDDVGTS